MVPVIEVGSRVRVEPDPKIPNSPALDYAGQEGQVRQAPPRDRGENVIVWVRLDSGAEVGLWISELKDID